MSASDKPGWRKSSFSNGAGNDCVELAFPGDATALRDSKNPGGAVLLMAPSPWEALRDAVRVGRFDLA